MYVDNVPSSGQTQDLVPVQRRSPPQRSRYNSFRLDAHIPSGLDPPRTYSFQETTFGRRLHRATLEIGYQLALDPSRMPEKYDRAFKLSLLTVGASKLISILKDVLDRGPNESLDSDAPMVHIGGAGTHYGRRDKFGVLQPKKQVANLGVIGPQDLSVLEHAIRGNRVNDMTVEITGFEGEWFDPYDVEGYLAEKGIFIDPTSSFAEADVDLISSDSTKSSSTSSSGSTMSPEMQSSVRGTPDESSVPYVQERLGSYSTTNSEEWMDYPMPMTGIGFSDASTGSWMNFLLPGEAIKQRPQNNVQWNGSGSSQYMSEDVYSGYGRAVEATAQQRKRTLLIDVAKFLKSELRNPSRFAILLTRRTVLTTSGSCLGRSPGFRRKDVDRALAVAAFDPF